jgi:holo-[acyl-carrier protein] synthase
MPILGIGLDVVDVGAFADQLADTASGFVKGTFRPAEQRRSAPGDERHARHARHARHLAGRFAAKEAFVKAWSSARRGRPPTLAPHDLDLREIEVVDDGFGRPALRFHGAVRRAVDGLTPSATVHLSISHDGGIAAAVVVLEGDG